MLRWFVSAVNAVVASRRFRTVAQVEPALSLLETHGYLRADTPLRTGRVGQPATVTYHVHPSLQQEGGTDAC